MPYDCSLHALEFQLPRHIWNKDFLTEPFALQKLQHPKRRRGIRQVFEIRRSRPVLQIVKVGNEGGIRQVFARCQPVYILRIGKGLDKLWAVSIEENVIEEERATILTSSSSSNRVCPACFGSSSPSPGSGGGSMAEMSTDIGSDAMLFEVVFISWRSDVAHLRYAGTRGSFKSSGTRDVDVGPSLW